MYRLLLFIFALQFIVLTSYAQQRTQLPNVAIAQNKNTVELKWFCQYEGVHAISIERSLDSGENYQRIGEPNTINKGEQVFTDTHPVCGSNWYRVQLEFNSGLLWNSQVAKIYMDSNQYYFNKYNLPTIPEQDSLFTGKKKNTLLVANDTNIDNIDAYSYFKSLSKDDQKKELKRFKDFANSIAADIQYDLESAFNQARFIIKDKDLHNDFKKKHNKIPDNWIKDHKK